MKRQKLFVIISLLFCMVVLSNLYIITLSSLPENFYASSEEIEEANSSDRFGKLIRLKMRGNDIVTSNEHKEEAEVIFKLFGFIPIKKVKVKLLPEEEIYVGGSPIGLSLQTDGAIVVSDTIVDLENSDIAKNSYFKNGDIIEEINDQKISSIGDIDKALSTINNEIVNIKLKRNNKEKSIKAPLLKDKDGKYKLGLWVKDDICGVGTLTFVKKDNGQFAALGHAITNGIDENIVPINSGEIYACSLVNIEKGEKNKPGELRCVFLQHDKQGLINKNTKVGVYGTIEKFDKIIDTNRTAKLGGRLSVKPGKAKIISTVSGIADEYDIEIIKANFQSKCDDKSLVIRVTDKRLLKLTGGIVQGMSGSPILQNGKVVGAVTHVFLNDPTKGYGVYTDWMLNQM